MSDDAVVLFSVLALGMSAVSVWVASLARRDSKKSAKEAEKSRRLGQAGLLSAHFGVLDRLIAFVSRYEGCQSDQISSLQNDGITAVSQLRNLLPTDTELSRAMDILASEFDCLANRLRNAINKNIVPAKQCLPKEIDDAITTITNKKFQYLNIG